MSRIEILKFDEKTGIATIKCYDPIDCKDWQKTSVNGRKFGYIEPLVKDTTTDEQRKHWHAIIKDISNHTGDTQGKLIRIIKNWFVEIFDYTKEPSLARNKMKRADTAKLLECALEYALMAGAPLNNVYIDDKTERMLHAMTMHRVCWVCNKPNAVISHFEVDGLNKAREKADPNKHKFMCLCHYHQTERQAKGMGVFCDNYHVKPIKLTQDQIQELGGI